jgi:mRNA deadenylase 3'-5' endonuclease subunit Ccr4
MFSFTFFHETYIIRKKIKLCTTLIKRIKPKYVFVVCWFTFFIFEPEIDSPKFANRKLASSPGQSGALS